MEVAVYHPHFALAGKLESNSFLYQMKKLMLRDI